MLHITWKNLISCSLDIRAKKLIDGFTGTFFAENDEGWQLLIYCFSWKHMCTKETLHQVSPEFVLRFFGSVQLLLTSLPTMSQDPSPYSFQLVLTFCYAVFQNSIVFFCFMPIKSLWSHLSLPLKAMKIFDTGKMIQAVPEKLIINFCGLTVFRIKCSVIRDRGSMVILNCERCLWWRKDFNLKQTINQNYFWRLNDWCWV